MLTHKGVQALLRVEKLMDDAGRAMGATWPAARDEPAAVKATPAPPAAAAPRPTGRGRADGNRVGSVAAN
jgi:hypothetical protein